MIDEWLEQIKRCEPLAENDLRLLCEMVRFNLSVCGPHFCRQLQLMTQFISIFNVASFSFTSFFVCLFYATGQGDSDGGVECSASELAGHCLR
jgi:hypothetical protein